MWTGDIVVLGTGSFAYPKMGSDGIGYSFLEKFHHTIIKPLPALVQLIGKGSYFKDWDGVRTDAILLGVETRTSSPIMIERDEEGVSNIEGIYPCGEGAGYAGGITTAAMDGIKIAEDIANKYKSY